MKIPKKIQIAGRIFDIVIDHQYCVSENCYGRAEYNKSRIVIEDIKKSGTKTEKIEQTLIHEILHVCNDIAGFKNDEGYVTIISELLYQAFKQIEK